ncbi:hypothetical protein ACIPSA_09290 [Streptomyces sp. NPDC086549]|uniref:hypothetical protein n=1 Tax=Streptomyces sp. NPDC086549 TaxID=3365752 RepID=UPI0037F3CFC8
MTTTPPRAHAAVTETGSGRGLGRTLMGVTAVLGPVLLAVAVGIVPYGTGDSSKEMVKDIAAHRTVTELSLWGWLFGSIALMAGILLVGLLAMRHSPKLGLWGLLLFGTGILAISATPSMDVVTLGGLGKGVGQDALTRTADGTLALPVVGVPTLYFVAAHVVGAILLGVALLRGRVIPAWAAWLLIVSMPLNVVGYAGSLMPVTVVSFLLMAVAFGAAGPVIVRHGTGWTRTA